MNNNFCFFTYTLDVVRSIFLDEIPVEGYTMKQLGELKKKVHDLMEQKLLEYNAFMGELSLHWNPVVNTRFQRWF
jgi:hypothetical protein